ncbi:ubiquitin-related domain-containing protein [Chytriomyces cf. hyalinus JEL632]|nr:ubiquitin-related domain-containing protein [Chytriomyces cf. hyalinus JEL632]
MSSISQTYGVRAMPTFFFFRNGEKLDEVVGADIAKVEQLVNKYAALSDPFPSTGGNTLGSGSGSAVPGGLGGSPFTVATDRVALIDMGFASDRVDAALYATKNSGLQSAMDWLFSHADESVPAAGPGSTNLGVTENEPASEANDDAITEEEMTAQSLKCDDCGRLLRNAAAAEFHAVKSGHQNFSESTQAIKPLTEDEKKAKLEELRQKLALKREEKRLQEIDESKVNEKVRRTTGKEMTDIKEKMAELEMKKLAEAKKREKEQDRIAKQRIKDQIELDKRDRAARAEKEKLERQGIQAPVATPVQAPVAVAASAAGPREYSEARIQLRLTAGGAITQVFKSSDPLSVVYEHVASQTGNAIGSFKLVQTFPRKVLDDQSKTLQELGLVPSAALIVQ